jgi:pyruvate formate lyase activating enzyme
VDHGKHLELTLLLIPGLNDAQADILAMADFISALNPDIPLHISVYHPSYQMTNHATGIDDVKRAIDLCKTKLNYVYGGNLGIEDYMHTNAKSVGKDYFPQLRFHKLSDQPSRQMPILRHRHLWGI